MKYTGLKAFTGYTPGTAQRSKINVAAADNGKAVALWVDGGAVELDLMTWTALVMHLAAAGIDTVRVPRKKGKVNKKK